MQFKVGDAVVHPVYGVGQVVRLDTKRFTGSEARQYYQVSTQKTTIWVPVETYEAIGLRRLTNKPDLAVYRDLLSGRPDSLDKAHSKRRLELAERMKQGSFQALCEMVRDLTARSWSKPLGSADAVSLRKARDLLCQEWAASNGVSIAEAVQEVEALLLEGKRAHS